MQSIKTKTMANEQISLGFNGRAFLLDLFQQIVLAIFAYFGNHRFEFHLVRLIATNSQRFGDKIEERVETENKHNYSMISIA